MKLTPASRAAWRAASASCSETLPQLPPMAQAPKPISSTCQPVLPKGRLLNVRFPSFYTSNSRRSGLMTEARNRLDPATIHDVLLIGTSGGLFRCEEDSEFGNLVGHNFALEA